ncbi:hypothetical protein FOH10_34300 [Nocardia otitidiscaviarum]|uniref:Uncharacterized protein n=1 Tax=Nocardia otitidiscaviarum TaxID=1823 RepID=A0A516NVV2_9NOCA|nr:hypothetical protein [Nocardia otitidiscaviarum]MCP9622538.1 hypothetical protein [Nocardia otitidiscaviarum]QDP83040.1 hypothetical protein FOH10_34300 [Nocardia otitidiscaviarum]
MSAKPIDDPDASRVFNYSVRTPREAAATFARVLNAEDLMSTAASRAHEFALTDFMSSGPWGQQVVELGTVQSIAGPPPILRRPDDDLPEKVENRTAPSISPEDTVPPPNPAGPTVFEQMYSEPEPEPSTQTPTVKVPESLEELALPGYEAPSQQTMLSQFYGDLGADGPTSPASNAGPKSLFPEIVTAEGSVGIPEPQKYVMPSAITAPRTWFRSGVDGYGFNYSQEQLRKDLETYTRGPQPWVGPGNPYDLARERLVKARYTPEEQFNDLLWAFREAGTHDDRVKKSQAIQRLAQIGIFPYENPAIKDHVERIQGFGRLTDPSQPAKNAPPPPERPKPTTFDIYMRSRGYVPAVVAPSNDKTVVEASISFGSGLVRPIIDNIKDTAALFGIGGPGAAEARQEAVNGIGALIGIGPAGGPGVIDSWKAAGKDFLGWDEWSRGDWYYALGIVVSNIGTTIGTGGVASVPKINKAANSILDVDGPKTEHDTPDVAAKNSDRAPADHPHGSPEPDETAQPNEQQTQPDAETFHDESTQEPGAIDRRSGTAQSDPQNSDHVNGPPDISGPVAGSPDLPVPSSAIREVPQRQTLPNGTMEFADRDVHSNAVTELSGSLTHLNGITRFAYNPDPLVSASIPPGMPDRVNRGAATPDRRIDSDPTQNPARHEAAATFEAAANTPEVSAEIDTVVSARSHPSRASGGGAHASRGPSTTSTAGGGAGPSGTTHTGSGSSASGRTTPSSAGSASSRAGTPNPAFSRASVGNVDVKLPDGRVLKAGTYREVVKGDGAVKYYSDEMGRPHIAVAELEPPPPGTRKKVGVSSKPYPVGWLHGIDNRGHMVPEIGVKDEKWANVNENLFSQQEKANQPIKREWEDAAVAWARAVPGTKMQATVLKRYRSGRPMITEYRLYDAEWNEITDFRLKLYNPRRMTRPGQVRTIPRNPVYPSPPP